MMNKKKVMGETRMAMKEGGEPLSIDAASRPGVWLTPIIPALEGQESRSARATW